MEQESFAEASRIAHNMKSMAGTIGAQALA
ncbi:hypothetical protein [Pseudomonas cavernicola]